MTPLEPVEYKVVELATVTDETIEEALNHWTTEGWAFQDIRFVMREGVRRPALAFLFFVRARTEAQAVETRD